MIRRMLVPLIGSGLLLAATAGSALAKCEGPNPPAFCQQTAVSYDFGSAGATIRAGTDTPLRVWVSRGEQPADARSVTLVLARIADATVMRTEAVPSGEPGMWLATVNLPAGGGWTVVAEVVGADGTLQRLNLDLMRVAAPPQAPVTTPPTTPISPAPPVLPIALGAAGGVALVLLAGGLRQRLRRRAPAS